VKTDVCMITEGSYPFVVGGVSTWVHDLLSSYKDLSFSLVHIGVSSDQGDPRYELPSNVLEFRQVHLMETLSYRGPWYHRKRRAWRELEAFASDLAEGRHERLEQILDRLSPGARGGLTPYDIFHSNRFWEILLRIYNRHFPGFSFIDFFWTLRFMVLPVFRILYAELPDASVYHATCTGYAGLLGAIATIRKKAPLIITEHGIYTNERMIEITQAQWIYREKPTSPVPTKQLGALQSLWMAKFDLLSRVAYDHATRIFTLYEGNRLMQIQGGAPEDRITIIPNGIDIGRFDGLYQKRREPPKRVALVGRIAPIKDVKTFVRAVKIVSEALPTARFSVLGPHEEDETYFEECERLARILSLGKVLDWPGSVRMDDHYPDLACIVLTSISEAQPYVILEALRAGVPVVATNVGACAELLLGCGPADESIGPAGFITNIRSPRETADAILSLLRDPDLARRMGDAGRERVGRYYQRSRMLDGYHDVYRQFCGGRGA
jgi:glycosyltransferase involved in cell wall biosynthesis